MNNSFIFLNSLGEKKIRWFIFIFLNFFVASIAQAATYNLSIGERPPCSTNNWTVNGANTVYTCTGGTGRVTLATNDILIANNSITISANNGFSLASGNTIGTATNRISLVSNGGTFTKPAGTNTSIFGNVTSNSGNITFSNVTLNGTLTTDGAVNLTGGSVSGLVTSSSNTITTNSTNLSGGAMARSGMSITGGTLVGAFTLTQSNAATFSGVTITSGSISGASSVSIGNSTIGSAGSPVNITTTTNDITLNASVVYGNLSAAIPSNGTVNVLTGSAVTGSCLPKSNPINACTPVPLGSWRMDETSWNGTANEVQDSSGNGNHGRARVAIAGNVLPSTGSGSPAYTSGSQSTCRYGAFDGTTGTAVRAFNYVELSGFPTLPNGFTFAAWIRSSNASAQHQRILVRDDADNGWGLSLADGTGLPKLRFFARNLTNSGAVTGQGSNPACGVFCIDTNNVITNNAWFYVAAVVDTTARTVTLYVYNASGVLQARTSGGYAGTWSDGTGTAAIGGETSASAEGRQNSFHFLGNIDEVDIYSGALTQTRIESLLPRVRTCPAPDHYELQVPDSGLACFGTDVIVRACVDSACTSVDMTINTNVTLSTSAGVLDATTLALVAGTGTTKLKYPTAADGANATVTLSNEATLATNLRRCCDGVSPCVISNSCSTSFNSMGFQFTNSATGTVNIANQIAGVVDNNVYLRALKTDGTTGACIARFTSPQIITMAYQCVNPTTCITGQALTLNGTAIRSNDSGASPILYNNVSLAFDANGSAAIPFNYSDVGRIRLLARLDLLAAGSNPAYTMIGTSPDFVVKPYTLAVSSVLTAANGANPGGTSLTGTAAGFVSAGAPFQVRVESRNFAGNRTPNFGRETAPESNDMRLAEVALIYPTGGTLTALTGAAANSFTATTPQGTFVNSTVAWHQVGSFTMRPELSDNDYLGAGNIATFTTSGTIGRFYPDRYTLSSSTASNGCGTFSYMGQPNINLSYQVLAQSVSGATVTNYGGNYATAATIATPTYVAENADGANGGGLSSRVSSGVIPAWASGVLPLTSTTANFNRQSGNAVPDGPYANLQLGLDMTDTFDARSLQGKNMNATTTGVCAGAACTAVSLGSQLNLRYGRLRLDDAFGPETLDLLVNFVTEYWIGNYFALNVNDSCTVIPRAAITYPSGTLTVDANRTVALSSGTTQGIYNNIDAIGVNFNAGTAGHSFSKPSVGGTGSFVIGINLSSRTWLSHDWNQDGNYSDLTMPNARYSFGSYRGNDRIIYWREKLQ